MGKQHKLPSFQLCILASIRAFEPIALTSAFPYLPEMIESFNVPKNEVAKWAGIISASMAISQCLTAIPWGRVSDRYGRKPTVLVSMLFTIVSTLLFGFSRSIGWAIVARFLNGIGIANVGILRTAVAEFVPQKDLQPRAFSILPLVWAVGSMVSPAVGGALAKPARQFPKLFGQIAFFRDYPFALPNLLASALFLVALAIVFLFLKETLVSKKHNRDYGIEIGRALIRSCKGRKKIFKAQRDDEQSALLPEPGTGPTKQDPISYREVFSRQSNLNLLVYTIMVAQVVAFEQQIALFMHMSSQENKASSPDAQLPLKFNGGLGLNSGGIGLFFALYGVVAILCQFVLYAPVARRCGILRCLKVANVVYPIACFFTPFVVLLPSPLAQQGAVLTIMIFHDIATVFAFPCITILLTNSAPNVRVLGTLNGVATSITALGKAAGPAITGVVFSLGVNIGYIVLPWFLLTALGVACLFPTWHLVEFDGFGDDDDLAKARSDEGDVIESDVRSSGVQDSLISTKGIGNSSGHGEDV